MSLMPSPTGHRPTAPFGLAPLLVAVMALGCAVLWIGLPVVTMWAAAKVSETPAEHFLLALPVTILAMVLFAKALFSVNRLYLRVTAAQPDDEDDEATRWSRGPLEPLLVGSLIIALVAIVVWFFLYAENPSRYGFVP